MSYPQWKVVVAATRDRVLELPPKHATSRSGSGRTDMEIVGDRFAPIPPIIHQTWKTAEIPERWRSLRESWMRHHPSWEYVLWTDEDNRRLIESRYPWFLPCYDGFPRHIQRVDAAKYFILYTYGGVYADLDCECLRPVEPLTGRGGAVVGRSADGVIECAFLASPPAHALWPVVFTEMQARPFIARALHGLPRPLADAGFDAAHVLFRTGPQMVGRAVRSYMDVTHRDGGEGLTILASRYLSRRSWWRRFEEHGERGGFIHHHYHNSWLTPAEARFVDHFTRRRVSLALVVLGAGTILMLLKACT